MEFLYEIILVPIILLILPFIAIPYFNGMSEKAKEHAERQKNLSKIELQHEYDLIQENKKFSDEKFGD